MTFEKALQALKSGKKIRQKNKPQRIFKYDGKNIYNINEIDKYGKDFSLSCYDLVSEDWEVCKEPKDYKIFVDKEKNVYIGGVKLPFNDISVKVVFDRDILIGKLEIQMPIKYSDYAVEL